MQTNTGGTEHPQHPPQLSGLGVYLWSYKDFLKSTALELFDRENFRFRLREAQAYVHILHRLMKEASQPLLFASGEADNRPITELARNVAEPIK
ncbi:hypothetical protein KBY66_03195 [Synechococcus sp. Tobar12-5m-g]|uniref:hypothetical protein n=1 Tax=unclassified Synechococcus TaxID=2626047 RepID=UPI0020CBEA95|nr:MULTISPECIES: hypothetical protein [unclassified Synechococcus]MCP9771637.1 hypothetical protein [Synechococcus sp. Tobar12-5m-g]MCP9872578.1 hypothetical protein [Synechococcus sp. Cruz CV-v-12]